MRGNVASPRPTVYAFPAELHFDELLLRLPTPEDAETIAPAFIDPAVGGEAGLPPLDVDELRRFTADELPAWRAAGRLAPYLIEDVTSGRILGGAALHHFDPMRGAVELGYWLFADARGRGVATRAVNALAEHAFANGVYRVDAVVRVGNVTSERVLERAGFVREGVKRRYLRHGGERVDATLFSRLADD